MKSTIVSKGQVVVESDVWMRSSYSTPNYNCVELRLGGTQVCVRDSKNVVGGTLAFGRLQWSEFLSRAVR